MECRFDKINDIFQSWEAWCHCDFRKMEALKVNKFGRTHWNTGDSSYRCEKSYFFNLYPNVQLVKRDIVTAVIYYYIRTEFHYAKHDARLLAHGGVGIEVSYFCYKNIKISTKMSINVFPHTKHLHTLSHVSRNETRSLCNSR